MSLAHVTNAPAATCSIGAPPLDAPGGAWRPLEALEAPGGPWRPLEAPGGPPAAARLPSFYSFSKKREDDLFEVGIEGVALNPNRK